MSAVLYGNEGFTHRLRLATVYEGIINSESYSKKVGYLLLSGFTVRATCIKGLFCPPMRVKYKNCFSHICSY